MSNKRMGRTEMICLVFNLTGGNNHSYEHAP